MNEREAFHEERLAALSLFQEAFLEAENEGVMPDAMAQAALFTALSEMVSLYGEMDTAKFCENLPQRILSGDFTLKRIYN
jgi:hypothetical protein